MVITFQIVHKGVLKAFDRLSYRLPALYDFGLSESSGSTLIDSLLLGIIHRCRAHPGRVDQSVPS